MGKLRRFVGDIPTSQPFKYEDKNHAHLPLDCRLSSFERVVSVSSDPKDRLVSDSHIKLSMVNHLLRCWTGLESVLHSQSPWHTWDAVNGPSSINIQRGLRQPSKVRKRVFADPPSGQRGLKAIVWFDDLQDRKAMQWISSPDGRILSLSANVADKGQFLLDLRSRESLHVIYTARRVALPSGHRSE
jgi:hypothetical protein